jgi:adenine-specific DNA-methyltransferase
LNAALQKTWQEWEIPRDAEKSWPELAKKLHADWWQTPIGRQKEIDASIAAKAEFEYLYDKPHDDKKIVRAAGPFTVESLSPHGVLGVDENDELIDGFKEDGTEYGAKQSFPQMILENLKTAACSRRTRRTRSTSPRLRPGPGIWSARKAATWKATPKNVPPSSSARNSAPSTART